MHLLHLGSVCADTRSRGPCAGWYIRLLRDEVLAEWRWDGAPTLHVHCHVSGQERWLAPPELRNYIFKREMALVRLHRVLFVYAASRRDACPTLVHHKKMAAGQA